MIYKDIRIVDDFKPIRIYPYTSKIEKSFLEYRLINPDINEQFNYVKSLLNIKDIPEPLQLIQILAIREICFGDEIPLKYHCQSCNQVVETTLSLKDFTYGEVNPNLKIFDIEEYYKMSLSDFAKYQTTEKTFRELAKSFKTKFKINPFKDIICPICGKAHSKNVLNKEFVLESLSSQSIEGMYQAYKILVKEGFSKQDIDTMLPFERDVYINLIKKELESKDKKLR